MVAVSILLLAAPVTAQSPYLVTVQESHDLAAALRNASAMAQNNITSVAVISLALDYGPVRPGLSQRAPA